MANRMPAWKRLGLKLKGPSDAASTPSTSIHSATNGYSQSDGFDTTPKRKRPPFGDSPAAKPSLKKPRTDDGQAYPPLRRQKSVTFAGEPDAERGAPTKNAKQTAKKPKKKKAKTPKPQPPATPPDLSGSLEYLRRWKTAHDTWKFNKNLQAHLIAHAFNTTLFPAADIPAFYEYIGDLKGHSRTRLLEAAKEIQTADMEGGKDHFPKGTSDIEAKEKEYQDLLRGILARNAAAGMKRKHFKETDIQERDQATSQRLAKRMRAETVLDELSSESDESEVSTSTGTTTSSSEKEAHVETVKSPVAASRHVQPNDAESRPAKRIRASKRRGADMDDDSSSSDSSSDSESEDESDDDDESSSGSASSSDSSSSDESDEDVDMNATGYGNEDSSSSSSSSSEDESDSDDE